MTAHRLTPRTGTSLLAAFVVPAALLLPFAIEIGSAHAQVQAVVGDFSGPGANRIRSQAVRALQDEVDLVSQDDFEAGGPLETDDDYAAAAAQTGVSAIVEGTVSRRGRRWLANVTVRGGDGILITDADFQGRNLTGLGRRIGRSLWRDLGDAIQNAPEPESDEPEDDPIDEGGEDVTVAVMDFDGPGSSRAREAVVGVLEEKSGVSMVSQGDIEDAAADLDVNLEDEDGRADVAAELGINTFVGGQVEREGRNYSLVVSIYNGYDGSLINDATYEGRNATTMLSSVREDMWGDLGGDVRSGEMPDVDDDDDDDDDGGASGPTGPLPSPLSFGVYLRFFNRNLTYNDDINDALREYSLGLGPMIEFDLLWYPAAHFTNSFAANIGLEGSVAFAFAINSKEESGDQEFPTSSTMWSVGARVRLPLGDNEIYARVGYGAHSFRIDAISPTIPKPDVPDVDYGFIRLGAGARFLIADLIVAEPQLAYLILVSTGQFEEDEFFPRSSGGGFEAGLRVGVRLLPWLEAQAGFHWQRYFFSINPEPGDARIAGGAQDQYISGTIGALLRWPESD
ncbi:MAG: hypothetical protein AAGF12_14775 [Myxococcota bacterium]